MNQRTSDLQYTGGKSLLLNNVKDGDKFNDLLFVLDKAIETLFKNDALDCINLKDLGIDCPDKNKTKACIIMEWLTANLQTNSKSIATLTGVLNTIQTSVGNLADEKVKVKAAGTSGYLESIISGPTTAISFENNKINFTGFIPVGARATINKNRLVDFDATGKGKIGTDLWGWAMRNGNNGLKNVMGHFPMFTDNIANADIIGGSKDFTISKDNIQTFSIPVSGTIAEALENNVKFKVGYKHYRSFDGVNSGASKPIKDIKSNTGDVDWFTDPANFKHSHGFNLKVDHTNANPTPISLLPLHIKEIPIERIIP